MKVSVRGDPNLIHTIIWKSVFHSPHVVESILQILSRQQLVNALVDVAALGLLSRQLVNALVDVAAPGSLSHKELVNALVDVVTLGSLSRQQLVDTGALGS